MTTSVSVIIPTWNRKNVLPRALHSVLNQTVKPDEIIVVDDGSTDGTAGLVKRDFPDVKLVSKNNAGVSSARNTGIVKSTHQWIAFLDSDDEWLPTKIEKQLDHFQKNPKAVLIHTDEIWIRNGVRVNPMKKHEKSGGWIFEKCLPLCLISPSSVLIKRALFSEIGMFDELLEVCEDYDLWLRICSKYPVHYLVEKLIVKYGGHEDQLSRKHWGMDRFRIQALDKLISDETLSDSYKNAAIKMLIEKAKIVLQGANKRENEMVIEECQNFIRKFRIKNVD